MSLIDWIVLLSTLIFITSYGLWKTRRRQTAEGYLMSKTDSWSTIGLSVMATQASAITFISTPGQAFEHGMGFVQFYFGVPIAIVILSITFLPQYFKLNVFTAYEFLEKRFDLKNRLLAAGIFLLQRGLSAGITIYAPSIILSTVLGWNLLITILAMGIFVIVYTVIGGTKAVNITDKQQMIVIFIGLFIAFFILIHHITQKISFADAVTVAGQLDKFKIIDTTFSFDNDHRYTIWSGLIGSVFLFMSYYGTDQSQVQRYLSGSSLTQSRLGLLFNAMFKIPMQFFILFVGVMVFVFFQFEKPPILFNQTAVRFLENSDNRIKMQALETLYEKNFTAKQVELNGLASAIHSGDEKIIAQKTVKVRFLENKSCELRKEAKKLIKLKNKDLGKAKDSDYVFLYFILNYLPEGIIGLLFAVIFCAAWSSSAGELNALATTSTLDFYKRLQKEEKTAEHYRLIGRMFTVLWGLVAMSFALLANMLDSLIEAVNLVGSLFYGTILGIFLVAFYFKFVKSNEVFIAAISAQILIICIFVFLKNEIGFLWYNGISCLLVLAIAFVLNQIFENIRKFQSKAT